MKTIIIAIVALFYSSTNAKAQLPFTPVPVSWEENLLIPKGMNYDVLFSEGDTVINRKGQKTVAKGDLDYNAFIPSGKSGIRGWFYTSHETNDSNSIIGDGGGGTIYEVKKEKGKWKSDELKYAVDFNPVGGTYNNCSGALTPKGTIFTTEEYPPLSNKILYTNSAGQPGFRDTSDFNGIRRYENMGWVVEVDLLKKTALHKLYKMGRFSHEGAWAMDDKKTVYLADDFYPAVFFKFIAEKENDYTEGQLYAYKQSEDGASGSWLTLPMDIDSLINIREVALRMGATVFVRQEWITMVNNKLYITETGTDDFVADKKTVYNGVPALYIRQNFSKGNNKFDYPYGALLEFDPLTNKIRPLVFGGQGKTDTGKHFSNPDGVTYYKMEGKNYLVINEDIIRLSKGRVNEASNASGKLINEIWWLDLGIKNPTVDDLQRFLVAPLGAETTGGYFSPDGSTYFVNIQHPSSSNQAPFNRSIAIAVSGFNTGKAKKKKN